MYAGTRLHSYVFLPNLRMVPLKFLHQRNAPWLVNDDKCYTAGSEKALITPECAVFSNYDPWYLELNDGTRAHHTWTQRGEQGQVPIAL